MHDPFPLVLGLVGPAVVHARRPDDQVHIEEVVEHVGHAPLEDVVRRRVGAHAGLSSNTRGSTILPVTAAAATDAGLAKKMRAAELPMRPSMFSVLDEMQVSPAPSGSAKP